MKILAIEITGNSAAMLMIEGDKTEFSINNLGKILSIPKGSSNIKDILEFQTNFSKTLQNKEVDKVVLCEGGHESKKMRVRMEFAVLSECEKKCLEYKTYPTNTCTRFINSQYEKNTNRKFSDDLTTHGLPKYMSKTFVAGWRFLE